MFDFAIRLSAVLVSIWLMVFPFVLLHFLNRPGERKLRDLMEKAEAAPTRDEQLKWYRIKNETEQSVRSRLGCLLSAVGFAASAIWVAFVLSNASRIGRAIAAMDLGW